MEESSKTESSCDCKLTQQKIESISEKCFCPLLLQKPPMSTSNKESEFSYKEKATNPADSISSRKLILEKYVPLEQMQQFITSQEIQYLITLYFSNPIKSVILKAGEVLMRRGEYNDRLYFVRKGKLRCEIDNFDGTTLELFIAQPNSFIGLYSFFSKTFYSSATIYALEDVELSYIDKRCLDCDQMSSEIYKQFMPYVVNALKQRGINLQETVMEKERAIQQLINNEKYTCLGEMAAGIAHELNNAIAVLERNTRWLSENLPKILASKQAKPSLEMKYLDIGLTRGRNVSSREVRKRTKELEELGFSSEYAETIALMGLADEELPKKKASTEEVERFNNYWETGATCHDMLIAAQQAAHVVKSVKELAQHSQQKSLHTIEESIQESIVLLHIALRQINFQLDIADNILVLANKGELVQVWTNLLKNAYESLIQAKIEHPEIKISVNKEENYAVITITDNGPGIPRDLLPKLFQPHITTKSNGQFIGLGLGLTIVHRIVTSYHGTIKVESVPGRTVFAIHLPIAEAQ